MCALRGGLIEMSEMHYDSLVYIICIRRQTSKGVTIVVEFYCILRSRSYLKWES